MKTTTPFIFLMLLLLGRYTSSLGQSYPGFVSGNYAGAAGSIHQPASIADNAYPWDIVFVGVNAFADNNYGKAIRSRAFMNFSFGAITTELIRDVETKYAFLNVEATGPSFMVRLKNAKAVGFTSRVRTYLNADGLTGDLATLMADGFNNTSLFDQRYANQQYYLKINSWQEYGVTYAQVVRHTPYQKIKAGITAKLLIENGGAHVNFITGNIQNIGDKLLLIPEFSLDFGYSEKLQTIVDGNFSFFKGAKGLGVDLGIELEYYDGIRGSTPSSTKIIGDYNRQTNTIPKYKYKLGFSLLDVGRLKYNYGTYSGEASVVLDGTDIVDLNQFQGSYDNPAALGDSLNNMVNFSTKSGKYTMGLPTAFQGNIDYRLKKNVFVNANVYANLSFFKFSDYNVHDISNITVTPRWENNWLGLYVPFYMNIEGQFNMGLATHLGPLVIGAHDFLPFLVRKESTSIGAYFMLKTFIPNKKNKKNKVKCGSEGWERSKKKSKN